MAHPRQEHAELLAKFGHMITVWNELEQGLRYALMFALESKCPPSPAAEILTAHMNNRALCDAFRTAARELKDGDLQACMLHAVKGVELLREYRNYFAHGFTHVGWQSGAPIGFLQAASAKSRLTLHEKMFSFDEIEGITGDFEHFRDFIGEIYSFMRDGHEAYWRELHPSWPQMPALPKGLQKPRLYPLDKFE